MQVLSSSQRAELPSTSEPQVTALALLVARTLKAYRSSPGVREFRTPAIPALLRGELGSPHSCATLRWGDLGLWEGGLCPCHEGAPAGGAQHRSAGQDASFSVPSPGSLAHPPPRLPVTSRGVRSFRDAESRTALPLSV